MTELAEDFYWTKLNESSDWEPARLANDRWLLIGDGYQTYTHAEMFAIGQAVTLHEWAYVVAQARILCDRLGQMQLGSDGDGITEDYRANVEPIVDSLRNALDIEDTEPFTRQPLTDARQLGYIQQMLVNVVIPIAEAEPLDGDFTATLTIKRRAGKALVDANLTIPARQARR